MSNLNISNDGLVDLDYESRNYLQAATWPVPVDQSTQRPDGGREMPPLQTSGHAFDQAIPSDANLLPEWTSFQQPMPAQLQYSQVQTTAPQFSSSYGVPLQTSPVDLLPASQAPMNTGGLLDGSYLGLSAPVDIMPFTYPDFQELMSFPNNLHDLAPYSGAPHPVAESSSPTDTYLEVRSLTSSSSDNGWATVDHRHQLEAFPEQSIFINPTQTLHDRTLSESSYSDFEPNRASWSGSWVDVQHPINSPGSDSNLESVYNSSADRRISLDHASHGSVSPTAVSPIAITRPIPVPTKKSSSPIRSPGSQSLSSSSSSATSPPGRKNSRKSPISAKTAETKVRKQSQMGKPENTEKRIGKRKGPLKPDQRKQASEIRKLRACLRCKFLKKTCDKGEPCAGCQPSHARLWQVPCTRIDIKEIGYFMKDWKADYERHITMGFSVGNIKGFSEHERTLFVTHGYGQILPINAREVYVRDEECFNVDWVENVEQDLSPFEVSTMKLSAGIDGISSSMLSDYLDRHIDGNGSFEKFVDDYFDGTPFLTEMLKTAFRYYYRTKLPVIRKALKLILAYNLTLHITMVEGIGEEEGFCGTIEGESSRFRGKTMAPVMINFQIKCAMAAMWRELQKDVLEELSALYSSVYSGDKLKNWPTIFILASILLAVWEEIQFDCHYRVPDAAAVDKFCHDMESTPVGVIVGLFQAISQKLPTFADWETGKHHQLLNSNPDVCQTMTEVRHHVTRHDAYLRSRSKSTFNRNDFDCLSNKFLSRLVIRAN
ncbi:Methionine--tRNA ligase [Talaromyces islandicus]|uniref:Methionine--tRNA ligase n=1 Tax=Talaromyces islandicus TaxID=28573 RepID=A0A0U1M9F8_TALIS|nr:Methionine--tRNA ligase [Talaromyces islandicus]